MYLPICLYAVFVFAGPSTVFPILAKKDPGLVGLTPIFNIRPYSLLLGNHCQCHCLKREHSANSTQPMMGRPKGKETPPALGPGQSFSRNVKCFAAKFGWTDEIEILTEIWGCKCKCEARGAEERRIASMRNLGPERSALPPVASPPHAQHRSMRMTPSK